MRNNAKNRNNHSRTKGFTMLEVMAVLIILGLLAAVVMNRVSGRIEQARITSTKASLRALHNAVNEFKMDTGRYPSEELGLQELVEEPTDVISWQQGGYLETTEIPRDGWGNEFVYERYPESGAAFLILSYGADGEPGGEGPNEDLLSTSAN